MSPLSNSLELNDIIWKCGNRKKNKPGPAKLSDNISKNPFLQSTATPPTLSENNNNILFLDNRTTTGTAYGGNPFLSHTAKPTCHSPIVTVIRINLHL